MAKRYPRQEILDRLYAEIALQTPRHDRRRQWDRREIHRRGGVDILRRLQHRLFPDAGLRLAGWDAADGGRERNRVTTSGRREVLPQVQDAGDCRA